jgi:hypothetical protein
MPTPSEVHITLCDPLNPGFGYQIRVTGDRGEQLLFTSRDPVTGKDLETMSDALRVASWYDGRASMMEDDLGSLVDDPDVVADWERQHPV